MGTITVETQLYSQDKTRDNMHVLLAKCICKNWICMETELNPLSLLRTLWGTDIFTIIVMYQGHKVTRKSSFTTLVHQYSSKNV